MPPRTPRSRAWSLTWNNYPDTAEALLEKLVTDNLVGYLVYQHEVSSTGTPHLQIYIHMGTARTMLGMKRLTHPDIHLEISIGNAFQNKEYCTKLETRVPGTSPKELGTMPSQGRRADLLLVMRMIRDGSSELDVATAYPMLWVQYRRSLMEYRNLVTPVRSTVPSVSVFVGKTGLGKTRRAIWEANQAREFHPAHTCILLLPHKGSKVFFDGYNGQENLIIDEFNGQMPVELLLRLLDRYPLRVDVKQGTVEMLATKIWITSNIPMEGWYPDISVEQKQALSRRVQNYNVFLTPWSPPPLP